MIYNYYFPYYFDPSCLAKDQPIVVVITGDSTQLDSSRVQLETNWHFNHASIWHVFMMQITRRSERSWSCCRFSCFSFSFFLFFCFPSAFEPRLLLKNEIFIGRLSFRYISWIVINFIDNCHILMAWLCAWLSDCYCFVWFALYVRGICTAKIFLIFLLIFPWPPPPSASRALRNCFRRKLLHEPQARPGPGGGDISMGNMLPANICRSVLITHI